MAKGPVTVTGTGAQRAKGGLARGQSAPPKAVNIGRNGRSQSVNKSGVAGTNKRNPL